MKSTTLVITSDGPDGCATVRRADRWGSLPLLVWLFINALPLSYKLEPARQPFISEVYERSLETSATTNSLNSAFAVLLLAAIYGCAGWMLLKKPKTAISLLWKQWPLLLFLLLIAVSVAWSYNTEKVIMSFVHSAGVLLVALAAAVRYRTDPWLLPKQVGYVLGASMVLQVGAVLLMPSYAIDWFGRWQGLTTHPNTLGALALSTVWANAAVILGMPQDRHRWLHALLALLAVLVLVGTNSVTSMIVSGSVVVVMYALTRQEKGGIIGWGLLIVGLAMVILSVLVGLLLLGNVLQWSSLLGLFGRSGDFSGRTFIWADAAKAIAQHPLLGWSFDGNAYLIQTTGMPYLSYHNGYLDLLVGGGVIALGLFFLLLATWRRDMNLSSRLGREILPFSAPYMLALLVGNLTESSLAAPRNQMWVIFITLLLLGACRKSTRVQVGPPLASSSSAEHVFS
jgi:exopolysaccharide production protein ExoQ